MPRWWKSGNTYMYSKTGEGGCQGRGGGVEGKARERRRESPPHPRWTGNLQPQPDPCPSQKWPGQHIFFSDHPTQNPAPYSPSAKKWAPGPAPGRVVRPRGEDVGRRVPRCGTGIPTSGSAEEREEERGGGSRSYGARWSSTAAPRRKADRGMD